MIASISDFLSTAFSPSGITNAEGSDFCFQFRSKNVFRFTTADCLISSASFGSSTSTISDAA